MPPLNVLMKPSSGMCNMNCDYCFYCDETEKRRQASYGFMSEETLKNVIRKTMLKAQGSVAYAYQGGEPSLRGLDFFKRAVEYQTQYNRNHITVTNAFQTNGTLLNKEWCEFFRENHFLVGISLDGTQETHDLLRKTKDGNPTFRKVMESIAMLKEAGVDFNILTVVNSVTAQHITEIYRFYKEMGFEWQQYILCLDPLGEGHGQFSWSLSPEQYARFLITLFDLWYKDWRKGRYPYIRQFENYIGILAGIQPESCEQRGSCGIQTVVEADGSVYPCDFYMLDEYCLGNLNTDRLEMIDKRRKERRFLERSLLLEERCQSCRHYSLCRGGCFRSRDLQPDSGKYIHHYCDAYLQFFDSCADRMKDMVRIMERVRRNVP